MDKHYRHPEPDPKTTIPTQKTRINRVYVNIDGFGADPKLTELKTANNPMIMHHSNIPSIYTDKFLNHSIAIDRNTHASVCDNRVKAGTNTSRILGPGGKAFQAFLTTFGIRNVKTVNRFPPVISKNYTENQMQNSEQYTGSCKDKITTDSNNGSYAGDDKPDGLSSEMLAELTQVIGTLDNCLMANQQAFERTTVQQRLTNADERLFSENNIATPEMRSPETEERTNDALNALTHVMQQTLHKLNEYIRKNNKKTERVNRTKTMRKTKKVKKSPEKSDSIDLQPLKIESSKCRKKKKKNSRVLKDECCSTSDLLSNGVGNNAIVTTSCFHDSRSTQTIHTSTHNLVDNSTNTNSVYLNLENIHNYNRLQCVNNAKRFEKRPSANQNLELNVGSDVDFGAKIVLEPRNRYVGGMKSQDIDSLTSSDSLRLAVPTDDLNSYGYNSTERMHYMSEQSNRDPYNLEQQQQQTEKHPTPSDNDSLLTPTSSYSVRNLIMTVDKGVDTCDLTNGISISQSNSSRDTQCSYPNSSLKKSSNAVNFYKATKCGQKVTFTKMDTVFEDMGSNCTELSSKECVNEELVKSVRYTTCHDNHVAKVNPSKTKPAVKNFDLSPPRTEPKLRPYRFNICSGYPSCWIGNSLSYEV